MDLAQTLGQQIREDWTTHNRRTLAPGLHALVVHRIGAWARQQPAPVRQLAGLLHKLLNNLLIRNVYGMELHDTTVIGRRVRIAHHMGVVLGPGAVVGDDVLIRQNVTLGRVGDDGVELPTLAPGVELGAGAVVLGGVVVGAGARIGPNAVVLSDVPAGATVYAPLSKVLRQPVPDAGQAGGSGHPPSAT